MHTLRRQKYSAFLLRKLIKKRVEDEKQMKKTDIFDLLMKSGNYGNMVITSITFHCTFSLLLGRAFKKVRGKY